LTDTAWSKWVSVRLDPEAFEVLEWAAALVGVPTRTYMRVLLQERASELAAGYRSLDYEWPKQS